MCRFVVYQGHPVCIADLLYRPRHSLVKQSMRAEQMSQPFNADGYGVGFYTQGEASPCIIKSCAPAWSNKGIENIASRLSATHIFAHIRAASPGLAVQDTNCHPYGRGRYQFMHNGDIGSFRYFKRRLQNGLSDAAWEGIDGSTDSEHAFALFLDRIGDSKTQATAVEIREALLNTLDSLVKLSRDCGHPGHLVCNFAVSDGCSTVVSRFSLRDDHAATLYYSVGERYILDKEDGDMSPGGATRNGAVLVSSEPITRRPEDWVELPVNHTITIDSSNGISIEPIKL